VGHCGGTGNTRQEDNGCRELQKGCIGKEGPPETGLSYWESRDRLAHDTSTYRKSEAPTWAVLMVD
jgi:hypothetical protein